MKAKDANRAHSDDSLILVPLGGGAVPPKRIYVEGHWVITVLSAIEELWQIEASGRLIVAVGNILAVKEYYDELFRISYGDEELLENLIKLVEGLDMVKRTPLMIYIQGTTRLVADGTSLYKLCFPDGAYRVISGDIFKSNAFASHRKEIIKDFGDKFIGILHDKFIALYDGDEGETSSDYEFHVLPQEELWTLKIGDGEGHQRYMGLGDCFSDPVFANIFNIVNDGKLSQWLKEQFKKYNIVGEAPMLWHFYDDGKVRTVMGERMGGPVFNPAAK